MLRNGYYYRREILTPEDLSDNTHWDKSGNNIYNGNTGNVGIDTANPLYTLDINGDLHVSNRLYDNLNTAGIIGQVLTTTGTGFRWTDVSNTGTASYWLASGANIYNGNIGNVGVGTSTPSYKLDVSGETRIQSNNIRYGIQAGQTGQQSFGIALGYQAGYTNQGTFAISVGYKAGYENQGFGTVGIGSHSGAYEQQEGAVSIGNNAAVTQQGSNAIAIGSEAASYRQGEFAIAIGYLAARADQHVNSTVINATGADLFTDASNSLYIAPIREVINNKALYYNTSTKEITYGDISSSGGGGTNYWDLSGSNLYNNSGTNVGINTNNPVYEVDISGETRIQTTNVRIGRNAGYTLQGPYAVSIGYESNNNSDYTQVAPTVAIGYQAGYNSQREEAIAIGSGSGYSYQQFNSIAIGYQAGYEFQREGGISVGQQAGYSNQQDYGIAIGFQAGYLTQGGSSIAMGYQAGYDSQSSSAIAIGYHAGYNTQGGFSVAIGYEAGYYNQDVNAIAIGATAGYTNQGNISIAIGSESGFQDQADYAIAIGYGAGFTNQGLGSIAIGAFSGQTDQTPNSIVINATTNTLNSDASNSLYIAPIREVTNSKILQYNTTTKEVTYSNNIINNSIIDISNSSGLSGETLVSIGNNQGYKWTLPVYGSFSSDISQNINISGGLGYPTAVTYNRAEISHLCDFSGSRIYVRRSGVFKFSYSIQMVQTANQSHKVYIYIKQNGVILDRTASTIVLLKDSEIFPMCEYVLPLNKDDYIEVIFYSSGTTVSAVYLLDSTNVPPYFPSAPSIISNIYSLVTYP
jgi:hypothetical protein